jgi:hypothetical protein
MGFAVLTCITAISLNSCGLVDFDHSENGNLDGYWHLVTVDSLTNGVSTDLGEKRYFWAIQATLLELYSPDWLGGQRFVSRISYQDNRLTIIELRNDKREEGDPVIENVDKVSPFGVNNVTETFQVEELLGRSMTLSTTELRLRFKKM